MALSTEYIGISQSALSLTNVIRAHLDKVALAGYQPKYLSKFKTFVDILCHPDEDLWCSQYTVIHHGQPAVFHRVCYHMANDFCT